MNGNSAKSLDHYDAIKEQIFGSLKSAQAHQTLIQRKNSRYTLANIVLGALAALSAGAAGTIGNAENWKPVCLFAAACSVGVTVTARLQNLKHKQLTETSECVGQLKALKVETLTPPYELNQVSKKYQQILAEFPTVKC
jgi:hypothetical protein